MNEGRETEVEVETSETNVVRQAADELIKRTSEKYKEGFEQALVGYRAEVGPFPEKVEEFIRRKGWLEPRFATYSGDAANKELKKIGFEVGDKVRDDEILLVYQMPKPVTQFWNKRAKEIAEHEFFGKEQPKQVQYLNGTVIEWGYFYRKLRNLIWKEVGGVERDLSFEVSIRRGNAKGDHSNDFYYVFLISEEDQ